MAAPATLNAASLEEQVFQACQNLQLAELSQPAATRPNNITVGIDTEGKLATITISLPLTLTVGTSGEMVIAANPYL